MPVLPIPDATAKAMFLRQHAMLTALLKVLENVCVSGCHNDWAGNGDSTFGGQRPRMLNILQWKEQLAKIQVDPSLRNISRKNLGKTTKVSQLSRGLNT